MAFFGTNTVVIIVVCVCCGLGILAIILAFFVYECSRREGSKVKPGDEEKVCAHFSVHTRAAGAE